LKENLPLARKERLVIKELDDEVLVYDVDSDKAHCLNQTAARVWKNCDGKRTVAQLRLLMEKEADSSVPEEIVWLALDQLEQFKLLNVHVSRPSHLAGMSRRQLMRKLVIAAAVSIPVITSIIVPTAAQAASCNSQTNRDDECPCNSSSQCASGCCRNGQFICKPGGGSCL
jgi:coenzyme PQQ synthesis protein D (PqqD)